MKTIWPKESKYLLVDLQDAGALYERRLILTRQEAERLVALVTGALKRHDKRQEEAA